jgi:hypothetical protein
MKKVKINPENLPKEFSPYGVFGLNLPNYRSAMSGHRGGRGGTKMKLAMMSVPSNLRPMSLSVSNAL